MMVPLSVRSFLCPKLIFALLKKQCNPSLNGHLPPFLVRAGGLNSGMMMAHVTAASLVSENKVSRSTHHFLLIF